MKLSQRLALSSLLVAGSACAAPATSEAAPLDAGDAFAAVALEFET